RRVVGRRRPGLVTICVPSGLTQVERSAVVEATLSAGAREAHLIEEALAAAIGAGLPVAEAVGSLVLDVGGGTSEVAVTALGDAVVSRSVHVGGYDLDDAIVRLLQHEHKLLVGQEQAEQVKLELGTAVPGASDRVSTDVGGRDLVSGLLRRASVGAEELREALKRPLAQIVEALKELLEQTPAELSADVAESGVMLVGGGALLPGFDILIRRETGLRVTVDREPLTTVARGAGAALEELERGRPRPRTRA